MLGNARGSLQERGIVERSVCLSTLIRITLRSGMPWHYEGVTLHKARAEFYFTIFFLIYPPGVTRKKGRERGEA
jgi:hypothetical protein